MAKLTPDEQLAEDLSGFYSDPLGYVMYVFPWDTYTAIQQVPLALAYQGRFNSEFGPDVWACELLDDLGRDIRERNFDGTRAVRPIRYSTVSGHGIGKGALTAWLVKFILDTRPFSKGIVTANTSAQLKTKTWAEVGKWHNMSLTEHWFKYNAGRGNMSLAYVGHEAIWRCDAQTCRDEDSEAFQGLHAANSTPFYIFDEACFCHITEVLTDRGWVLFSEIKPTTLLFTPEGWQKPIALHASHRRGKMLRFKKRGLSLVVTPSHELYGRFQRGEDQKLEARALNNSGFMAPRVVDWGGPEYLISDDELHLVAWYYSEGHLLRNNYRCKDNGIGRPRKNRRWTGFGITNNEDRGISDLLNRIGLRWGKSRNQWIVYEPERADVFAEQGIGCLEKTLPAWMLMLSRRQLRLFLSTYIEGDGYKKGNSHVIYTSSPTMASMLHAIAVLAGYNSSMRQRKIAGQKKWIKDHWATSSVDGWVITLSETGARVKLTRKDYEEITYDGMVYCATVPAGLLLTRREGTVIWSGNSGISKKIWSARAGGATDGEPMSFDFGNPTRNSGDFFENCVGVNRHRYTVRQIDSRDVHITNKDVFAEWEEDHGEDSDWFKVKVRGMFPSMGNLQFISTDDVEGAMGREVPPDDRANQLLIGVDVARFGGNETVIYPRVGYDARSFAPTPKKGRYRGLDMVQVEGRIIETIHEFRGMGLEVAGLFIDEGGIGGGVVDHLRHYGYNPVGVNFGGRPTDNRTYRFKVDEIWGCMKAAMGRLALPGKTTATGTDLKMQLTQREFGYTKVGDKINLESKDDMQERLGGEMEAPDIADALACTWATEVAPMLRPGGQPYVGTSTVHEFDPLEYDGPKKERVWDMGNRRWVNL